MRMGISVAVLAITGMALSGCLTTDSAGDAGAATTSTTTGGTTLGGGTTTSTDTGSGISGDTAGTGGPNTTPLSSGATALAFSPNGRSPMTGGFATLTRTDIGLATESATVAVDPHNTLGWGGPETMQIYPTSSGTFDLGANYTEYRRISGTTDTELQYWQYTDSYAAQYRDVSNGGGESAFAAWFFDGNFTDIAAMPTAGTANYAGQFTATATTAGWQRLPNGTYDPNGLWRMRGSTAIAADFGAGTVSGTLTPTDWEKFDNGNVIVINGTSTLETYGFHSTNYDINATITDNTFTGTTTADSGAINGDNPVHGGFFGPTANEVTGVFATFARFPAPTGGDIGINDDRRSDIDVQGMFHGE